MTKIYIVFFYFLFSLICLGQQVNLEQFYSAKNINSNINLSSSFKIDSLYKAYLLQYNIDNDEGGVYHEFVYSYNFFLEELNKSGRVYFGDEISIYLNKIKNDLLKNRPENARINVYLTDFHHLNAFTNDFGNIYVNVGAIAKLENENELYALMAHEISHVLSRHSYKLENLDNHLVTGKFEGTNEIDELDYHKFSQKHELEADSLAFILMKECNRDFTKLGTLFDKLRLSNNPIYNIDIDLSNILKCNDASYFYLENLKLFCDGKEFVNEVKNEDKVTTHPTVESRILQYEKIKNSLFEGEVFNSSNEEFDKQKFLAAHVLVKTLIGEFKFIESLYLVEQLLKSNSADQYLLKTKLKLLVLITQSKYFGESEYVINEYGSSCANDNYLLFRQCISRIPALEMNILTIEQLESAESFADTKYLNRLKDFSYQFLYKYNPNLFITENNELAINKNQKYNDITYSFPISKLMNGEEKKGLKTLKEDNYYLVEEMFEDSSLVLNFLSYFNKTKELNKAQDKYKKHRNSYESMLTIDQFIIDFDPESAYKAYKKGSFNSYKSIPDSAKVAIVNSESYVFNTIDNKPIIDYVETLKLQEKVSAIFEDENLFNIQLINQYNKSKNITIADNHLHHLLNLWIGECLYFNDLIYSVADEELYGQLQILNTEYLVYNINLIQKIKKRKYRTLFYNIYFDVNTMGVAYVSTIAGSENPNNLFLAHYFYQSKTGKTRKTRK